MSPEPTVERSLSERLHEAHVGCTAICFNDPSNLSGHDDDIAALPAVGLALVEVGSEPLTDNGNVPFTLTRRTPEERDAYFATKLVELQAENAALRAVAEAAAEEGHGTAECMEPECLICDALAAATEAGSE